MTTLVLSAQEIFKAALHLFCFVLFCLTKSNSTLLFTSLVHKYSLTQTLNELACSLLQFTSPKLQLLCYLK